MPTYYPIIDAIPGVQGKDHRNYRAVATGEFRAPKAGEWYISGAIPCAYRMPFDGTTFYRIARIVKVRVVQTIVEVSE